MSGIPQRELSIEDVVSWTLKIYRDRFSLFFATFLAAYIPGMILGILVLQPILDYMNSYMTSQIQVAYSSPPLLDDNLIAISAVLILIAFLAMYFAQGFAIVTTSSVMKGGDLEPATLIRGAYGRYWGYLKTSILIYLGFFALVLIPALIIMLLGTGGILMGTILLAAAVVLIIYLDIRLSLYPQAFYLENVYATESLGRSYELLRGRVFLTLILQVVLWVVSLIPGVVVGQITGYFSGQLWFVGSALSLIGTALAAPIGPIALTVWYYSMRTRESPPPVPAPPTITMSTTPPPG